MGIHRRNFLDYDPYLSFSDKSNFTLKKKNGLLHDRDNLSHDYLFNIGRQAYSLIFDECDYDDFSKAISGYYQFVDELTESISDSVKSGRLIVRSEIEGSFPDSIHSLDDSQIINIGWGLMSRSDGGEHDGIMKEAFAILALHEIDNVLLVRQWPGDRYDLAVASSIAAAESLYSAMSIANDNKKEQEARRKNAYNAALGRLARDKDGKQEAKRLVREYWIDWQRNPNRYKSQAKFAKDMLDKFPQLENQVSIENWCRGWKKG